MTLGLFKRIKNWGLGQKKQQPKIAATIRKCRFEAMEPRQMLDADPVIAGVTYLENDTGEDTTPDYFEVTFQGGSQTTQMTQFVINGDQDGDGVLSDGDMFFDVNANSPGAGQYHNFQFHAGGSQGVTANDVSFLVSDDGLTLTVTLNNFEAGDVLAFTIDVDEVERYKVDKIASGVEFEGTLFTASFSDAHYNFSSQSVSIDAQLIEGGIQPQSQGIFYDEYDQIFNQGAVLSGSQLDLAGDNQTNQANRTAGAIDAYQLTPKPITISGNVFHDVDLDCEQSGNETGIAGVTINLQRFNEVTGTYEFVASTQTDASGHYQFGADLNLQPGKFRIIEVQPSDYLSVGATTGTVNGQSVGLAVDDLQGQPNILAELNIPLGGSSAVEYNFCEVKPVSLSGHVWHDANNDGVMGSNEERLANVLIRIDRTGGINPNGPDPFAGTSPIFVRTNASGRYEAIGLPPGTYQITEINNYPNEPSPLAGYIDGKDSLGFVGNSQQGQKSNDQFTGILLGSGDNGIQYNFGELKPVSISGHVHITTPEGNCVDPASPDYRGIEGVTIRLFDANGNFVAETLTDNNGQYEFIGLPPGTYSIVEFQPQDYLDGGDHVGSHGGVLGANDRITQINLSSGDQATNYDFCEREPATIKGMVWYDKNNNGVQDAGENGIGGVRIDLLDQIGNPAQIIDANGNVIPAFTFTEADGTYCFENLSAGTYSIRETQPSDFVDGKDVIGSLGGTKGNDIFNSVTIKGGQHGENYNFGEIRLASIEGFVFGDTDGDCVYEPNVGDRALENVIINLFDSNGNFISSTTTDANGRYKFNGLLPGEYAVVEITPQGYLNGDAHAGKINGVTVGEVFLDKISKIKLTSADVAQEYNFCEHLPAELSGHVWHDRNDNGIIENGEEGISNVTIRLFDSTGNMVAQTTTNSDGYYEFKNLKAGTYRIVEIQPGNFVDGKDSRGQVVGQPLSTPLTDSNDNFTQIVIKGDQVGVNYDFGEYQLGSISGIVHTDNNEDCIFDPNSGEEVLAGVRIELVSQQGVVLAVTITDAQGKYSFGGLRPGNYIVRQSQPDNYFNVGQVVGNIAGSGSATVQGPGDGSIENQIRSIALRSGMRLVDYNFCEMEGAEIHGTVFQDGPAFVTDDGNVPDDYRDQRDGVYTQGADKGLAGIELQLWYYINPEDGFNPRPVTLADVLPGYYSHLAGKDPSTPITVLTDANGNYSFAGLKAGNYIVFEKQPENYVDSNDTVGTTTGLTFNSVGLAAQAQSGLLQQFSVNQLLDSIANIRVNAGQASFQNNFSEVLAEQLPDTPQLPPTSPPPITPPGGGAPNPPIYSGPGLFGNLGLSNVQILGGSRIFLAQGLAPYTWHLSVVNAGTPRGEDSVITEGNSIWMSASYVAEQDWMRFDMNQVSWSFARSQKDTSDYIVDRNQTVFGNVEGVPVAGDFNGDGIDEIAIFNEGYWMIDINGNGRWDHDDMVAKLGSYEDRPVVGDWDGDGKDDIGIYGPQWDGDPEAIARDPGLPDFNNRLATRPKNIPPLQPEATDGARVMRLTSHGKSRADLIDHVFGYGHNNHVPVVGDWNGDGVRTIGMFSDGVWHIDLNGDGRLDDSDAKFTFGKSGDRPLVGDFNGDGTDEVAVYRNGQWFIDINRNHEMDAHDRVFEMGGASDSPVVGDWDGDGVDEPALYHSQTPMRQTFTEIN